MNYDETISLSQHDILNPHECADTERRVLALKAHWRQRSQGSLFTLGTASYLDAPEKNEAYLEESKATNTVLRETFKVVHERVRGFFQELLGESVFFDDRCALPGFHIFVFDGSDRSRDDVAARAHFDLQWRHAVVEVAPSQTVSFTLPIQVPSGGASMAIWQFRYKEAVKLGCSSRDYASTHSPQTVNYVPGRIVVHDGFILHAIGRSADVAPTGLRITMQGHGIRVPWGWMLYW